MPRPAQSLQVSQICCESHKNKCLTGKTKKQHKKDTQGREALDVAQAVHLFQVLKATGSVWTAALMLIHLYLGERADCVRRITRSWLSNLEPEASGAPSIDIPEGCSCRLTLAACSTGGCF